ncbi:opsin-5-like [Engraulis encrasicolus]|uniref:opsin-5-like n=1 Tax=Engraulis encrasicolus TaxID=184585 RepID=UPI002FD6E2C5
MDSPFITHNETDFSLSVEIPVEIPVKIVNIPWRNNNLTTLTTDSPLPEQAKLVIGLYLLVIGWLAWLGNSLVIFVLYRQKTSLQPTDFLTLNLAISDACISVFGYSRGLVEIFNIFQDDGFIIKWIWTCQVDGFFTLLFGLASINTLTVISVTRYIKGCHPNRVYCIRPSTINISLLCIWAGAFFWAMVPLVGWGSYTDRGYGTCEIDWIKANYSTIYKSYIISVLFSCFFIPVLIMLFSYISIINMLRSSSAMSADGYLTDRQRKMERDVTRVSVVLCTAFTVAWAPYAVVSMWSAWGYPVPTTASILTRMFAKSASFYNPLIYFSMSSKFRKEVCSLFPCTRRKRDTVRLCSFNHLWPKDTAAAAAAAATAASATATATGIFIPSAATTGQFYYPQGETKYAVGQLLNPSLPTGVFSRHQVTPPPTRKEISSVSVSVDADAPAPSTAPGPAASEQHAEYETDRL